MYSSPTWDSIYAIGVQNSLRVGQGGQQNQKPLLGRLGKDLPKACVVEMGLLPSPVLAACHWGQYLWESYHVLRITHHSISSIRKP